MFVAFWGSKYFFLRLIYFSMIGPAQAPGWDARRRSTIKLLYGPSIAFPGLARLKNIGQCATCGAQRLLKYAQRTICCRYACLKAAAAKRRARHADGSFSDMRLFELEAICENCLAKKSPKIALKKQQRESEEEDAEAAIAEHEKDRSPAAGEENLGVAPYRLYTAQALQRG
ncbi:hypothetical protein EMIHUDRAFT_247695 [Emiliania huxleyi CCMP1516]|uniref:Stc1 domain-containing protein n=2 Tax=Emiliania huxleyi TaxID=2903 RepID=A0A0D3IL14_EMIH1|nr:hypothetical protein EMIHUDRAFT_247695 [Emiliania huxleyi CCMP1516]EOD11949.1 hypothetical protein EMIHUDRAFT_247695 [Emiliania huxleyi CCMP1516]|eukprot:XP_005764378.1 hypothetical protein EMIHUDRAFT_247695 [Emiliania huxleyi CCMP1516]